LNEETDDGARKIAAFLCQIKAGALDLGCVFARLSNDEIAAIPDIARAMQLRGMEL
jgi:hypothetical protein